MRLRIAALTLLLSFTDLAWPQDPESLNSLQGLNSPQSLNSLQSLNREGRQWPTGCDIYYSHGDAALFEFIETRKQVDYSRYAGMTIAGVEYITLPIFNENNPDEDVWLYRLANRLHINTRPEALERQLVFAPGTVLQPDKIIENERLLRNNDYLVDAMILPHKMCGDKVYLLVVVRDVWTLLPSASASRTGGESSSNAGLTDKNLLGSGQTISIGYYDDADRSGSTFYYFYPGAIGNHTEMSLAYENNSDGEVKNFSLVQPFYELDSTWSAGVEWGDSDQKETIESRDEDINEYRLEMEKTQVFYGWTTGRRDRMVQRWRAGVTSEEKNYFQVDAPISEPPENIKLRYPWLEWNSIEDNYVTLSNISYSHRHEDILVGFDHLLRLGYATEQWGSSQDAWVFEAGSGYTASFSKHHLLRLGISAGGRYNRDAGRTESTFYEGSSEYYHFPDHKNRWYARLQYTVGRNLNDDEELTAGGSDTLRGYPDDYQRGNHQWIFTLERRYFTDYHFLQLVYLGAAAYIDVGRTWDTDASMQTSGPIQNNDTLANVGLGLRASPSKFNVNRVMHVDIAWPMVNRGDVDSYQLIISGRVDF